MSVGIKVYQTQDFIRKTAKGMIDRDRSIAAVQELAIAANYFKGYHILLDLRDTQVEGDHGDAMRVAA